MPKPTKIDLQNQIAKLSEEKNELEKSLTAKEEMFMREKDELKNELNKKSKEGQDKFEAEKSRLEIQISDLEGQVKEKQNQLNIREIKKLASAYKEQEGEYIEETSKWFKYVLGSFIILIISIGILLYTVTGEITWYERIEHYILNLVLITFLVFCLKQYSYYNRLRIDYANRKTLAQSYHNILTSTEDENIKSSFLEKASDVLCAKAEVKDEAHTIPEKLLESITEIAKNHAKKV